MELATATLKNSNNSFSGELNGCSIDILDDNETSMVTAKALRESVTATVANEFTNFRERVGSLVTTPITPESLGLAIVRVDISLDIETCIKLDSNEFSIPQTPPHLDYLHEAIERSEQVFNAPIDITHEAAVRIPGEARTVVRFSGMNGVGAGVQLMRGVRGKYKGGIPTKVVTAANAHAKLGPPSIERIGDGDGRRAATSFIGNTSPEEASAQATKAIEYLNDQGYNVIPVEYVRLSGICLAYLHSGEVCAKGGGGDNKKGLKGLLGRLFGAFKG